MCIHFTHCLCANVFVSGKPTNPLWLPRQKNTLSFATHNPPYFTISKYCPKCKWSNDEPISISRAFPIADAELKASENKCGSLNKCAK